MGRYPFLTAVKAYLDDVRNYYQPSTLAEVGRKLRYIGRVFCELHANGEVATTNPTKMGEREIAAFLGWMKSCGPDQDGLDLATQHKYIGYLQGLLDWAGNGTIRQMRTRKRFRIVVPPKPLYSLPEDDVGRIRQAAERVEYFRGDVARFYVGVLPFCGLRPGEIEAQDYPDVDTVRWRMVVSRPKGRGSWAVQDIAPILPPGRQPLLDFLDARSRYLRSLGLDPEKVKPLVPYESPRTHIVTYWPPRQINRLKHEVEELAGVSFQIRDFRPTFAQMNKDRNVGIEAVSKMLRHRTTRTTELYYARIRDDKAFAEAEKAWTAIRVD